MTLSSRLLPHQHPRQLRGCAQRNWPHRRIVFHRSISTMCDYVLTMCWCGCLDVCTPTESSMENLSFTHYRLPDSHPLDLEAAFRGQRAFSFCSLLALLYMQLRGLVPILIPRFGSFAKAYFNSPISSPLCLFASGSKARASHVKVSRMKMQLLPSHSRECIERKSLGLPHLDWQRRMISEGGSKKVSQTLHYLCLWLRTEKGCKRYTAISIMIRIHQDASGIVTMLPCLIFDLCGHAPCHTI